jgi:lipoate-protein ligase A
MLCVLNTGIQSASDNMTRDAILLKELHDHPILHLYDWDGPSATYGHFIMPEKHLDIDKVHRGNLTLARRPTGGGIVFHIWDYAFSFLMPSLHPRFSQNPLENYRFVNEVVLEVMQDYLRLSEPVDLIKDSFPIPGEDCQNFCMARPTQYDVVYKGFKIAGAAQRKTKLGYLHQGTISLARPDEAFLMAVLLSKEDVVKAMRAYTFAPLGLDCDAQRLTSTRSEIGRRLEIAFRRRLDYTECNK